uniref:Uncharacterized protein n=1 Tax=Marseillevirus LCMAC101 TaxID=2506602 RepID=A0A481YT15_9VIRU|nr:MAG: hypothetical protein LCMAC101_02290 [Marseillevirus LCMAC101]
MSTEIIETMKKVSESSGFSKITPEVSMDSRVLFLIRIDGEEWAFVNSEEEAKLVIDSFAASEVNRLESDKTEVYRKDSKDGKKIVISEKTLGMIYNSSVHSIMEIDFRPVSHAVLTKGRHELPTAAPIPPPLPPQRILIESLERIRAEAQGKSVGEEVNDDGEEEEEGCEEPEGHNEESDKE